MKPNYPLFFIHISKTAGSSFRVAATEYFGTENVVYDYGINANETHPQIKKLDYEEKDRYAAGMYILENAKFLTGHVAYSKYAPFIPASNIFTFVREPSQQVRSHYEHFKRLHGYKSSFESFIGESRFCNTQHKALAGSWLDAIGFIGITEKYSESLSFINNQFDTDIPGLEINTNLSKVSSAYEISEHQLELIRKNNSLDFELYNYSLRRFERQKKAIVKNKPFIRSGATHVPPKEKGKVFNGWALDYGTQQPVMIDVFVEGKHDKVLTASDYRHAANEKNIHRNGFVGFRYVYPKNARTNAEVKFVAKATGEVLFVTHVGSVD